MKPGTYLKVMKDGEACSVIGFVFSVVNNNNPVVAEAALSPVLLKMEY
jgi:hypothetical protein